LLKNMANPICLACYSKSARYRGKDHPSVHPL
jgi:hypothetical protein